MSGVTGLAEDMTVAEELEEKSRSDVSGDAVMDHPNLPALTNW